MGNLIVKDCPSKAGGPIEALFRRALQVFAPDFVVRKGAKLMEVVAEHSETSQGL